MLGFSFGVAAACGSNQHDSPGGTDDSLNGGGGEHGTAAVPGDTTGFAGAYDEPVMTKIPIPPNCQHPGFPGGDQHYDFDAIRAQLIALKPGVAQRHAALLDERYDLSDNPASDVAMTRGKMIQVGVRVRLPEGQTWESLSATSADD